MDGIDYYASISAVYDPSRFSISYFNDDLFNSLNITRLRTTRVEKQNYFRFKTHFKPTERKPVTVTSLKEANSCPNIIQSLGDSQLNSVRFISNCLFSVPKLMVCCCTNTDKIYSAAFRSLAKLFTSLANHYRSTTHFHTTRNRISLPIYLMCRDVLLNTNLCVECIRNHFNSVNCCARL